MFLLLGAVQQFPNVHFSYFYNVAPWLPWFTICLGIYYLVKNENESN